MKAAISILVIVLVIFGVYKLWQYWDDIERRKEVDAQRVQQEIVSGNQLPGLPSALEDDLRKAQEQGPKEFKAFIERIKPSPKVQDPRLAWIELDYVVMAGARGDPAEAKRVFRDVKARVTPESPVYRRVKELEKTYD